MLLVLISIMFKNLSFILIFCNFPRTYHGHNGDNPKIFWHVLHTFTNVYGIGGCSANKWVLVREKSIRYLVTFSLLVFIG
jgi:hypothetical protein